MNFFGETFETLFVNNNGNVTFDAPFTSLVEDLGGTNRFIIAPFHADVDTSVGNVVTYGQGTVNGRPAFGVNWPGVGCFEANISVLNFFQLRLVDRSDIGPADFDILFGYDSIQWEEGGAGLNCQGGSFSARVGYANPGPGAPGTFFELPGSGVAGAFLDSNLETGLIHNSPLRFAVRSGIPVEAQDRDSDDVLDELDNCPTTPNPDQADSNFNGIGDFCTIGGVNSTAAFLQAGADGSTTIEPTPLPFAEEPELSEKLMRIVEFRVQAGLTESAEELTQNLVDSLVDVGLVDAGEADELIEEVIAALVATVDIDIRPNKEPNPVNLGSRDVIPVAILTTDDFDAAMVDPLTVEFGPDGAFEAHGRGHIKDADRDGDLDLILHFAVQETGISCGDISASLTGETFDGQPIEGSDSIRIVRCN